MMRIGEANMKMWSWEVRAKAGGATVRGCEVLRNGSRVFEAELEDLHNMRSSGYFDGWMIFFRQ